MTDPATPPADVPPAGPAPTRGAAEEPGDGLEQLPTEELRERAYAKAQHAHDVGFFWDLLRHSTRGAAVASEDASAGAIGDTIAEAIGAVRQMFGHGYDDLEPLMRAKFLDYLRKPGR